MARQPAETLPFLDLAGASLHSTCTVAFGSLVGAFLPLKVHTWDHPESGQPFQNTSGCLRLGDLTLLSTCGSAIDGEVEQRAEAQLVLPYLAGTNRFRIHRETFTFRSDCLFIPAAHSRFRLHCTACSGVILSVPPESLQSVAEAIAGPGFDALPLRAALERPGLLTSSEDPRRGRLRRQLMEALACVERSMAVGGAVAPLARLDDLIRRLVVMLLLPDLLEDRDAPRPAEPPFPQAALVEWLLAHLDEPISLSDMEQRSHYSRRSLQLAFRQRFGCGPMQWLRQQRLAKARALLERPSGRGGLLEVALACGYLSPSAFSRDFLARYGERPSQVARRFRPAERQR